MTNEELLKKNFTQKQINWFAEHGSKVSGTQDEMLADIAQQLHDAKVYDDKDQRVKLVKTINRKGKVYDLQSFATAAGFSDRKIGDKTLTAADQLYAALNDPNTPSNLKKNWGVAINDVYGEGGTEFLKRRMEVEKRNREYAAQKAFDDRPTVTKILDAIISPRETEARAEGRAPSDKDKALDRTENALMAMPFGVGAKVVSNLVRAPRIASKIIKGAGAAAGIAGVPHAMEGLDALAYSPEENLDRSQYRESDAMLGTLTNVAAPVVAQRTMGRLGKFIPGSKGNTGMSEIQTAQLEQAIADGQWKKPSKQVLDVVTEWNATQDKDRMVYKIMPELEEKAIKEAETGLPVTSDLEISRAQGLFNYAKSQGKNSAQNYLEAGFIQKAADEMGLNTKASLEAALQSSNYLDDVLKFSDDVLKDANFFDKLRVTNPKASVAVDAALEMGKNWVTNKYGSKRDADVILSGVSNMLGSIDPKMNLSKKLADDRKADVDKARTELKKKQVGSLMTDEKLTEEDRKWLGELFKNPKMMEGYGNGNDTRFKNWLLIRGQDILRGTELFRPTYEAE